jgi:class 3 adenylate cyclase
MSEKKSVDELLKSFSEKESELSGIGDSIKETSQPLAIVFMDLVDSTIIKQRLAPERWLGYVFRFIQTVTHLAALTKGTVVKRIGDELLITFDNVDDAESFITTVNNPSHLDGYNFKIAADYGEVYHFQFDEALEKDPYGNVVDRCARLAKLAGPTVTLCSASYTAAVNKGGAIYHSLGKFKLKGFEDAQEIFLRANDDAEAPDNYHLPLLELLNNSTNPGTGYRYIAREFSPAYFRDLKSSIARPFLLRELLNVPKLPFNASELYKHLCSLNSRDAYRDYYGMLVEWEVSFGEIKNFSKTELIGYCVDDETDWHITVHLPASMLEVVRLFKRGEKIMVRGIICDFSIGVSLNYVDIALAGEKTNTTK